MKPRSFLFSLSLTATLFQMPVVARENLSTTNKTVAKNLSETPVSCAYQPTKYRDSSLKPGKYLCGDTPYVPMYVEYQRECHYSINRYLYAGYKFWHWDPESGSWTVRSDRTGNYYTQIQQRVRMNCLDPSVETPIQQFLIAENNKEAVWKGAPMSWAKIRVKSYTEFEYTAHLNPVIPEKRVFLCSTSCDFHSRLKFDFESPASLGRLQKVRCRWSGHY